MQKTLILIIFFSISLKSISQNLITNSSFEITANEREKSDYQQRKIYNYNSTKQDIKGWYSAIPNFYLRTQINYGKIHIKTYKTYKKGGRKHGYGLFLLRTDTHI